MQQVGELAEAEGHHPDISFGWGYANGGPANEEDQRSARERLHHGRKIDRLFDRANSLVVVTIDRLVRGRKEKDSKERDKTNQAMRVEGVSRRMAVVASFRSDDAHPGFALQPRTCTLEAVL